MREEKINENFRKKIKNKMAAYIFISWE